MNTLANEKVLQVNDLSFSYGKKSLFTGVSFSVSKGEFVKLTGPNGSGKSTLVRLLINETELQNGNITLFGENIRFFKNWRSIGYLPQKNGAAEFPATAEEIILTAMYRKKLFPFYTKKDKQKVLEALKITGMESYAKAPLFSLSGGQLQRVLAARLIAANPSLLILDEPMTGIDVQTADYLYDLFKSFTKKGTAVLMISHDITKRDGIFDKTLCLAYGNIIEIEKNQVIKEIESIHTHPQKQA